MEPLTEREIDLIEKVGIMKALLDVYDRIMLCMTVRLGGAVHIDSKELHYTDKTYSMEKIVKSDDLTQDVRINARLK